MDDGEGVVLTVVEEPLRFEASVDAGSTSSAILSYTTVRYLQIV